MASSSAVLTNTKIFFDIIQSLILIWATFATAEWAYRSFANKEKIQELKELKKSILDYSRGINIFLTRRQISQTALDSENHSNQIEEKSDTPAKGGGLMSGVVSKTIARLDG